jgi:hypothetical protein
MLSEDTDTISLTMKIIVVLILILVIINTVSLSYLVIRERERPKYQTEKWSNNMPIANSSATYIKPPMKEDEDYGQKTYAGCSCAGYGVKNNKTMPFNNDSNLYAKTIYQGYQGYQ